MRSLLFIPGDSESKLAKGLGSGADALILDLEDAVATSGKEAARRTVAEFLDQARLERASPRLFVRVNGLDTGLIGADLDAVMPHHPKAIVLPKTEGANDMVRLANLLAERETASGGEAGATGILPIATETARGLLAIQGIPGSTPRLLGVTWGGEDLAADLGAEANRDRVGVYTAPYDYARLMTLITAAAAEVDAIDAVYTAFRDDNGLRAECESARRDGFGGKLAIHPAQVPIINAAFSPSFEAVSGAREIVAAMEGAPGGVVSVRGKMIDHPHLRQARRILARAGAVESS